MRRCPDHIGDPAFLDAAARIHHKHAFRHLRHSTHIMGNQDDGCIQRCPQITQQGKNLCLHGDIQRGRRLIRNQNFRLAGKGDGNHHALALPPRQLVRIIVNTRCRIGNTHRFKQLQRPLAGCMVIYAAMQPQHLDNLLADGKNRIKRCHRLLKDHRNFVAA